MDAPEGLVEAAQVHESAKLLETEQKEEQALIECIEAVKDDEIQNLLGNESLLKNYCNKLLENFKDFEDRENALEQLIITIKKLEVRSEYLQASIETWLPQREKLLNIIRQNVKLMSPVSKLFATTRIVGSAIDCVSLFGNIFSNDSNVNYVNMAIEAANIFGFLNFATSATELLHWKSALGEIMKQIQNDQKHFAPIQEWFLQNNELEQATKAVFSFDITSHMVTEFERLVEKDLSDSELLQLLLESVLKEDRKLFKNVALIRRLVKFAKNPASRYWCGWVLLRHHTVTLHIARMLLQMNNPQVLASTHNVSALARPVTSMPSISHGVRILINVITMYEDINTLRTGGIVKEMRKLRRRLEQEMIALRQISRLIKQRSK